MIHHCFLRRLKKSLSRAKGVFFGRGERVREGDVKREVRDFMGVGKS